MPIRRCTLSILPLRLDMIEIIVATILNANADSRAFIRIKDDLKPDTVSSDLELLKCSDEIVCERCSIRRVLFNRLPVWWRRAWGRDEEVLLQIGNL